MTLHIHNAAYELLESLKQYRNVENCLFNLPSPWCVEYLLVKLLKQIQNYKQIVSFKFVVYKIVKMY